MKTLSILSLLLCAISNPVTNSFADDAAATMQLAAAIEAGEMAGVVVQMSRGGETIYHVALGNAQVEPTVRPMRLDTVFDLASLTKPIATATSVMILVDQNLIDLSQPVAAYWPAFASNDKQSITVRDLLLHRGGLIADNPLSDYSDDQPNNWRNIANMQPRDQPGEAFRYSDMGFIVLGKIVDKSAVSV